MMYSSTLFAALGFTAIANAHMVMNTPAPFKTGLNNSPLDPSGSDFPCKFSGTYKEDSTPPTSLAVGSTQPLKFTGGATHGGGSCQISVTYDKVPTKNSVWKVIHSIEGGCPVQGVAGNAGGDPTAPSPTEYTFPVPDIPTGDAVLAWTWFNKIGNREMYMNCAPVVIGGNTAKRDEQDPLNNATQLVQRDQAKYDALPNMFVANIAGQGSCTTEESVDLIFPNAGDSVTSMGSGQYKGPAGCAAGGGSTPTKAPSSGSAAPSAPVASATKSSLPGGVFATVAPVSGSPSASTPVASSAVPASSAVQSSAAAPSPAPTSVVVPVASTSAAPPAATGTTGSGSALTGPCTTEGMWNCIGGTSFQQCASGSWSIVQQMAAGMSCTAGQSSSLSMKAAVAKRALRFFA
ncbi:hypothetical protein GLAREA_11394 [Glarea lozoyensis ATCC 20868]|uniref:Chitin-binding type-4 domain-containing protein n=1 Tax=Glarea lozoyensis (strain ATCC 20868 / MF5171) TaxID=1116229 RepID=S3DDV5_GLAL2|nr:uncharacterized protein GLAREA_11394 [Glarea lozoyensis ATCC 20868]EPE24813.1 hypothetical protein GLAREA_11394 [Glarea lozoyensis ATCC 20868]